MVDSLTKGVSLLANHGRLPNRIVVSVVVVVVVVVVVLAVVAVGRLVLSETAHLPRNTATLTAPPLQLQPTNDINLSGRQPISTNQSACCP